ncbi:MAG: hypothetical protein ACOZAN_00585 [Patescibacteria group bacterium]
MSRSFVKRFNILNLASPCSRNAFRASILLLIITIAISVFFYPQLQPVIPIFYSLSSANQHLADKELIFLLPVLSTIICLLHFPLTKVMANFEIGLRQIFAWMATLMQLLALAILVRTISVVI